MNQEFFLLKVSFAFLLAATFAFSTYRGSTRESDAPPSDKRKYTPYIATFILPLYMVTSYILRVFSLGLKETANYMFVTYFAVFFHLCIYYSCLLLLMPKLRKRVSARACAALWLLPNYLYIFCANPSLNPQPLFVLRIPSAVFAYLGAIWTIGFVSVLLWKIIEHYRFRNLVLKNSTSVTDSMILNLLDDELQAAGLHNTSYQLVSSPVVLTPLSFGFTEETTYVILPNRQYTPEELSLILRHEIIHICRQDSMTKFFLVFCAAICWFNPLIWLAMHRCAEDLELSCDETVLLHSDQQTRTRYAELLLQTAGDERGFTTCLAASMDAMRYRLKSIVSPSKRATGSFIVAIITFILMITCGYVSLAYHETTGHEAIFHSEDMEQFSLVYPGMNGRLSRGEQVKLTCTDEVALFEYLSELQVCQITGSYALYEVDEEFTLDYLRPDGRPIYVDISKNYLRVTHPGQSWAQRDVYYIPDGADWEYLTSLFTLP